MSAKNRQQLFLHWFEEEPFEVLYQDVMNSECLQGAKNVWGDSRPIFFSGTAATFELPLL